MKDDCLKQDMFILADDVFCTRLKILWVKQKVIGLIFMMNGRNFFSNAYYCGKQLDSGKLSNEIQEKYSELFPWSKIEI